MARFFKDPRVPSFLLFLLVMYLFGDFLFSTKTFDHIASFHFDFAEKSWFYSQLSSSFDFAWLYPHNQLGHSLASNPASGLLYAPNLLHAIIPLNLASKILFVVHFFVLYFGFVRLLSFTSSVSRSSWGALLFCSLGLISSLPVHVAFGYFAFYPLSISYVMTLWKEKRGVVQASFSLGALFLLGDPLLIPTSVLIGSILGYDRRNLRSFLSALSKVTLLTMLLCSPHLWVQFNEGGLNSRTLGIDPLESLSYSTHPIRILDWLFPWIALYDVRDFLGPVLNQQWWFPRLGGGLVICFLVFRGFRETESRTRYCLTGAVVFFLILSLGVYFTPSSFLLAHIPGINLTRYPERYLLYALPGLALFVGPGLRRLNSKVLACLLVLGFAENLINPLKHPLVDANDLRSPLPSKVFNGDEVYPARYLLCETGLQSTNDYRYFDTRAYSLSMVNGTSNTRSSGFKVVTCPWALHPSAQEWLGYTHVLSSGKSPGPESAGLVLESSLADGEIWRTMSSSPWKGYWINEFIFSEWITGFPISEEDFQRMNRLTRGIYTIDPKHGVTSAGRMTTAVKTKVSLPSCDDPVKLMGDSYGQVLRIQVPSGCSGLLGIPVAFHFGWTNNQGLQIYRINEATIGIDVPEGLREVTLRFDPPLLSALALFSFFLQFLFLFIIVRDFFIKKRITNDGQL